MRIVYVAWALSTTLAGAQGPTRDTAEQVWLAGRYDANRVVVYFNKGKFNDDTVSGREIPPPKAGAMFPPREMTGAQLLRFHTTGSLERFSLGDRYDLIVENGRSVPITLTALVAFPGDEQVGNDSYAGALGTFAGSDASLLKNDYYAVRRHAGARATARTRTLRGGAALVHDSASAALRARLIALVHARVKSDTTTEMRRLAAARAPTLDGVTTFTTIDGNRRYYVRASYRAGSSCVLLNAIAAARPVPVLTSLERAGCMYDAPKEHPALLNAVDLGDGRTGLVIQFPGADGMMLSLLEYRDGVGFGAMRVLWSISASE